MHWGKAIISSTCHKSRKTVHTGKKPYACKHLEKPSPVLVGVTLMKDEIPYICNHVEKPLAVIVPIISIKEFRSGGKLWNGCEKLIHSVQKHLPYSQSMPVFVFHIPVQTRMISRWKEAEGNTSTSVSMQCCIWSACLHCEGWKKTGWVMRCIS